MDFRLKSKTLARYFLSYLVLAVFIFIVITALFINAVKILREETKTSVMAQFHQVSMELDKEVQSLKNIADLCLSNGYLMRYKLSQGDYRMIQGIEELGKIRASNSFFEDIFITYHTEEIFSARGKATADVYMSRILGVDGESAAAAIKALMEIDTIAFFSLYTSEGRELNRSAYLLCCYPLSSGGTVVATVGFIVPAFRMETMLENLLRDYDSSARLIIPGGQVFAKVDTPDSGISFEGEQGIAVYAYQSDRTGIQIELALNENKMFSRIREMQQMSYLVLILLFAISVLLSIYFSRRNYRPIGFLSRMAMEHGKTLPLEKAKNEFDAISQVMNLEAMENQALSRRLYEISPVFRQQTSTLVFSGMIQEENLLRKFFELSQVSIEGDHFAVMLIIAAQRVGMDEICDCLLEQRRYSIHRLTTIKGRMAAAVLLQLSGKDSHGKQRRMAAAQVQAFLKDSGEEPKLICFGQVYESLSAMGRSYAEAVVCARQCMTTGVEGASFFERMARLCNESYYFCDEELEAFRRSLQIGNAKQITVLFRRLLDKVEEQNLSAEKQRFHYYELLHEVFHHVMQAKLSQELASEILSLDCEERHAFQMQMETVFYDIEKEVLRPHREGNSIEDIVAYLQEHFTDTDLTLSAGGGPFSLINALFERLLQRGGWL